MGYWVGTKVYINLYGIEKAIRYTYRYMDWRLPRCADARIRVVARARLRVIQPMLRQAGN